MLEFARARRARSALNAPPTHAVAPMPGAEQARHRGHAHARQHIPLPTPYRFSYIPTQHRRGQLPPGSEQQPF